MFDHVSDPSPPDLVSPRGLGEAEFHGHYYCATKIDESRPTMNRKRGRSAAQRSGRRGRREHANGVLRRHLLKGGRLDLHLAKLLAVQDPRVQSGSDIVVTAIPSRSSLRLVALS